jgi:glycosyltransferase involved in cell wall biosynthesis
MKIAFICDIPRVGFSGGRYYSVLLASCISQYADVVDFYTCNTKSQIYEGFSDKYKVNFHNFGRPVRNDYDFCIVFPDLSGNLPTHESKISFSNNISNKTILMSFETANWWNESSPMKRNPSLWSPWISISKKADPIFYLSEEMKKWGEKFYNNKNDSVCWAGPVNLRNFCNTSKKQKQVTILTRLGNLSEHKGHNMISALDSYSLDGYTINVNIANTNSSQISQIKFKNNIDIKFSSMISEAEKFSLLEKSDILFFPTQFEGLGLPPLEAECCGCKVLCTDLPVLRQHPNNKYFLFKRDYSDFGDVLAKCVASKIDTTKGKEYLLMQNFGKKMFEDLSNL